MLAEFTIYSKDGCSYCDRAKALCEANSRTYTELKLGRDIEYDALLDTIQHYGHGRTMPLIVCNDDGHGNQFRIGGYTELSEYLKQETK